MPFFQKHYANYIICETGISQRLGLKLEKPVDGRDCNYFFFLLVSLVTEDDRPHNERLLLISQHL